MLDLKPGKVILEDGTALEGNVFGYTEEPFVGEVVFTTGMTGYQETLTDPSYTGQIVTMTYPLIGNYGINLEDMESKKPSLSGLIVREKSDNPNNWRCEMSLHGFLNQNKVIAIENVDTRALTRKLRISGVMKGIITPRELTDTEIQGLFDSYHNEDVVLQVSTKEKYVMPGDGMHLGVLDFGVKKGILKELNALGLKLTVYPADTSAEEILADNPSGIFLSNGPGDPKNIPWAIDTVKTLLEKKPVVGICLGHQLIALALGCNTRRMRFGHHGANHPVREVETGNCFISSQNHEYVVHELAPGVKASFVNVNDGSIEGICHETLPVWSVQFHPEASPGPLDTGYLFKKFVAVIRGW